MLDSVAGSKDVFVFRGVPSRERQEGLAFCFGVAVPVTVFKNKLIPLHGVYRLSELKKFSCLVQFQFPFLDGLSPTVHQASFKRL